MSVFAASVPLKQKLMASMLLVGMTVLIVTVAVVTTYEFITFKRSLVEKATALGGVVAANSTAALAFKNEEDAEDVLAALQAEKSIIAAALYDDSGRLFARYPQSIAASELPATPGTDGYRFDTAALAGFQPIAQDSNQRLGTLYLKSDLLAFNRWLTTYLSIAVGLLAPLFAIAFLLSRRLQGQIAEPILTLARTAELVSQRRDYTVRAPAAQQPEVRSLTESFNQMLDRIEGQNVELNDAAQRLRAVMDSALSAVVVIDANGKISEWNARAESIFGWSAEQTLGRELADFIIPPAHRAAHREGLQRVSSTGEMRVVGRTLEMSAIRRDGSEFPAELSITALRSGNELAFCGFLSDITERKQAQARVQSQFARLNLLQQITRAIGERLDLPSICQVVIRRLEEDLPVDVGCVCQYEPPAPHLSVVAIGAKGTSIANAIGLHPHTDITIEPDGLSRCVAGAVVYEPDVSEVHSDFARRLVSGGVRAFVAAPLRLEDKVFGVLLVGRRTVASFSSADCEFLHQLSEHVALAVQQVRLYEELQKAYDELRQSQQAILQQERLRVLGQMASGIAHDINNAISPVTLYTETLLEREPALSERGRGYLMTIQRAIDDVARTVERMREFYRPREGQANLVAVNLNVLVPQVLEMTRARWANVPQERGIVIDVRTELEPRLPSIAGAESEIRDALTNLIFNAVDAMPQGGTLTLRTRSVATPGEAGCIVHMEVSDTGIGMDEDVRRRCLEPFYTTKGERGTGLGLAMVYGMVQRHSGNIEIDSEPGRGTTMRLSFVTTQAPLADTGRYVRPTAMRQLRILIVDDDPLLLQSLRDILEADGHKVTTADGGQAGIDTFQASIRQGPKFAIVVTDLGMPHVDGRAVAARVKSLSADTPVLLLTGWGQRLIATNSAPPHVDRVLSKPPRLQDLRTALFELTADEQAPA
jgi:PAS domain S-box-containing protein